MRVKGPFAIAATLVLACASFAHAEDKFVALAKDLAREHAELARALEKANHRHEARIEFLLALSYDPDCTEARGALGYRRENDAWVGSPANAPPSKGPIKGKLAKRVEETRRNAVARLLELARAAKKDGRSDDLRALAGHALDEDSSSEDVRTLLDHQKTKTGWTTPRTRTLSDAFARCRDKIEAPEERSTPADAALGESLGAGALRRRETPYAVFYESKAARELVRAGQPDQVELVRSLEVTRASWRALLGKGDARFVLDSSSKPPEEPRDDPPPEANRPRFIVLDAKEHVAFVERAVEEPRRPLAKQLKSWSGWLELTTGKVFAYECALGPAHRSEWVVLGAVKTLLGSKVRATCPGFLVEGLTRFFDGHVTGRAELSYVSTKESRTVRERDAMSFDDLRARVRGALQLSLEGELAKLVAKPLNDYADDDSVLAFALVEFLLDKHPKELKELMGELSEKEPVLTTFERCTKKNTPALEREWKDWMRAEY